MPLSAVPELQEWLQPFIGGKGPRGNVVMVRLGNEAVEQLDLLVEARLFGSRSERRLSGGSGDQVAVRPVL